MEPGKPELTQFIYAATGRMRRIPPTQFASLESENIVESTILKLMFASPKRANKGMSKTPFFSGKILSDQKHRHAITIDWKVVIAPQNMKQLDVYESQLMLIILNVSFIFVSLSWTKFVKTNLPEKLNMIPIRMTIMIGIIIEIVTLYNN